MKTTTWIYIYIFYHSEWYVLPLVIWFFDLLLSIFPPEKAIVVDRVRGFVSTVVWALCHWCLSATTKLIMINEHHSFNHSWIFQLINIYLPLLWSGFLLFSRTGDASWGDELLDWSPWWWSFVSIKMARASEKQWRTDLARSSLSMDESDLAWSMMSLSWLAHPWPWSSVSIAFCWQEFIFLVTFWLEQCSLRFE